MAADLIYFDVPHLYYLPQYLPVTRELVARGVECRFVFYQNTELDLLLRRVAQHEGLHVEWVRDGVEAVNLYRERAPQWVVFGNGFAQLDQLPKNTRSALLYHGIGVKDCYYDANLAEMNIRFVEGPFRAQEILRRFPATRVESTGFAKLDLLFGPVDSRPRFDLSAHGLSVQKKTLLYAPTFFPSSIEMMSDDWPRQFDTYNILIKPHHFSMTNPRYRAQREKIERWAQMDNVYVARDLEYSLLPFMACADILISEASSALFEFAALDKPIVWCDFLKLRWTYRGPLRFRFTRRMDRTILKYSEVGAHASRYRDLLPTVTEQLAQPDQYRTNRQRISAELIGVTDGHAGQRIAAHLLNNKRL